MFPGHHQPRRNVRAERYERQRQTGRNRLSQDSTGAIGSGNDAPWRPDLSQHLHEPSDAEAHELRAILEESVPAAHGLVVAVWRFAQKDRSVERCVPSAETMRAEIDVGIGEDFGSPGHAEHLLDHVGQLGIGRCAQAIDQRARARPVAGHERVKRCQVGDEPVLADTAGGVDELLGVGIGERAFERRRELCEDGGHPGGQRIGTQQHGSRQPVQRVLDQGIAGVVERAWMVWLLHDSVQGIAELGAANCACDG